MSSIAILRFANILMGSCRRFDCIVARMFHFVLIFRRGVIACDAPSDHFTSSAAQIIVSSGIASGVNVNQAKCHVDTMVTLKLGVNRSGVSSNRTPSICEMRRGNPTNIEFQSNDNNHFSFAIVRHRFTRGQFDRIHAATEMKPIAKCFLTSKIIRQTSNKWLSHCDSLAGNS